MYTRTQLLNILADFEKENARLPTKKEIRDMGMSEDPFHRLFGTLGKAKETYKGMKGEILYTDECSTEVDKDPLLKQLKANLSNDELKAIVAASGSATAKVRHAHVPYETGYTKFLVVSDTHIGHSKFREDWWNHMVERATKEKVQFALHAGDILEGMSTRPGHVYELSAVGFEAQFAKAREVIGRCPFPVMGIIGNHDLWYVGKADQGTNVGIRLEESLDNFEYLGADEGDLTIENIRIKLWHGNDGASYAVSYRGQKIVESLDGGDKPHILITGHDHKAIFFQTRNVHIIGAGTLCEQTSFMRGKKLAAHKGYWIVEAWSNEQGLVRIRPEWCPFY